MKEATGEVSMTVITLVAIGVIGGILVAFWPKIQNTIGGLWGDGAKTCPSGQYYDTGSKKCVKY